MEESLENSAYGSSSKQGLLKKSLFSIFFLTKKKSLISNFINKCKDIKCKI